MDLETYNETVNALNHRCLWARDWPGQILPATELQHVARYAQTNTTAKPAGLENLLWVFQDLAQNRFVHTTVFREYQVTMPRYGHPQNDPDSWEALPREVIGTFPYALYYWQQGWDLWERQATPMQHVAPLAYMTKLRSTLLSDWDAILADIRTGAARLQYLPYNNGKTQRHHRQERFTTWGTFGEGTIAYEETDYPAHPAPYYTPFYELEQFTNVGTVGNYGPDGSFQFEMYGTYETLLLENPYPYAIEITLLYMRLPTGAVNSFIAGTGTCDVTYTLPTPSIKNGAWDEMSYGASFWNSVTNAQRQTATITVPAYSTRTFGPTDYADFNVPTLSQYLWTNTPSNDIPRCAGRSGRVFSIIAWYHPLTESAQTP